MSPSNRLPPEQPAAAAPAEPATDDQVAPADSVPLAAGVAPNTAVSSSCAVSELR